MRLTRDPFLNVSRLGGSSRRRTTGSIMAAQISTTLYRYRARGSYTTAVYVSRKRGGSAGRRAAVTLDVDDNECT